MGHHRLAEPELAFAPPRRRECARHLRRRVWRDAQGHVLQGSRARGACRSREMAPPESAAEILRDDFPDIGPTVLSTLQVCYRCGAVKRGAIVAAAGRRIDPDDATVARFPLTAIRETRRRIDAALVGRGATALVTSAACGADLLTLSAA